MKTATTLHMATEADREYGYEDEYICDECKETLRRVAGMTGGGVDSDWRPMTADEMVDHPYCTRCEGQE